MLNGRYDYYFPYRTSQLSFFNNLGTADADKQLLVYDSDHTGPPMADGIRETISWFDRYMTDRE